MRKQLIAAVLIIAAVAAGYFVLSRSSDRKGTGIRTSGIVEGKEVNLSPKSSGRISGLCCEEGDAIAAGQIAIQLESDDLRASLEQSEAAVARASSDIRVAETSVENARANIHSAEADIRSAEADAEKARVQWEEAKREMERAQTLFRRELIAAASFDQAVSLQEASGAAYLSSRERINSVHARKKAAESQMNASISQVTSAKARLREAEAALAYSRSKLSDATIISPVSGTVIFRPREMGETVSPGMTLMTVVDLASLYVRADVEESLIGPVTLNSEAAVKADGMPGESFRGKVSEIGRYAEFATQRDVTRGRQDIKTFRIKIRLDDHRGLLKPGMTVEVEIPKKG